MKPVYSYIAALTFVCAVQSAYGQEILSGEASVENVKIEKKSDQMQVSMDIVPNQKWNVKSNRAIVLTPVLGNDENQDTLPSVQILGRNRYIYHLRNISNAAKTQVYKASETGAVHYEASIPYQKWMDKSTLMLNEDLCGCCQTLLATEQAELGKHLGQSAFTPVLAYIVPKAEAVKVRAESAQAYVTFPVSKSYINESYLNNRNELQKILDTLSKVRNDKDVAITGMQLKGYASPEGSYNDNARLAKSRTEAVAAYVEKSFGASMNCPISTSYEAENWAGLEDFIRQSDLPEKNQLLAIITSPEFADNPDGREWKIKSTYPNAYRQLLTECYPMLRRTDYRVEFTVRSFSIEEAKSLINTQPQKLSLQEMYNVAQTYEPGSDAYNDVFATAVRMFPQDATANLNAANSALQHGDLSMAEKYLQKAGDSGESILARGVLAMLKGDVATATELITKAQSMGVEEATSNLEQIRNM